MDFRLKSVGLWEFRKLQLLGVVFKFGALG